MSAEFAEVSDNYNIAEQKQDSYALESTLQAIKGVLDTIQTNTSKIGVDGAVDNVLSSIKQAVESINKKIIQGTKVLRTSSNKKTEEKSADLEIKNPKEKKEVKKISKRAAKKQAEAAYDAMISRYFAEICHDNFPDTLNLSLKKFIIFYVNIVRKSI